MDDNKEKDEVEEIFNRALEIQDQQKIVEEEEKEGKIFVIRPEEDKVISRLEKDESKLRALYDEGYNEIKARYDELMEYLNR